MGMMMSTPSMKAIASMMRKGSHARPAARKNATPKPIMTRASTRFSRCCPLYITGALEKRRNIFPRPASLPKAITLPENVIAPTKLPMKSSKRLPRGGDEDEGDFLGDGERDQHRDRHADHAEEVSAPRRHGRGEAFQR